ncbi:MAG: hypothetical protein BGO58_04135 [Sphingopyxis sp. 65-8]|uniref:universal stress protein n=1 Tax=uncultured Sphingomonas sp. TaxID=158754 RepID=UPI00086ECE6A|nr:universal stress protein [Sphingomonas sp. SCN 67-18]ODU21890.1 MAG: hypothetical protein ABS87_04025 [Sphingomonas sp. SCN 67-18]OJW26658.1 MAG: hypothetical protein BGO58_04135 [Sphingopyxis sp. 65-8]
MHKDARVSQIERKPEEVIALDIEARGAKLLIMGAYGHSSLRAMLVGRATTEMIRSAIIPVLLFR